MRRWPALWLLLLLAAPAAAEEGRALFTGQAGAEARLKRFPCHSCHGRDARGGVEGDVPAIDWPTLAAPAAGRPAYDEAAFHRAVTTGEAAGGRVMSRLMPRYPLDRAGTDALRAYLEEIGDLQRSGVEPYAVRIGVAALPDPALSAARLEAMRGALRARLGGEAVYGRRVALALVDPAGPAADAVLAVIAPPVEAAAALSARGVPSLAPVGALKGDEDTSIIRGLSASREAFLNALAAEIVARGDGPVAVLAADEAEEEAFALALSLADPDRALSRGAAGGAGELVLLGAAPPPAGAWRGRVWIEWRNPALAAPPPAGAEMILALDIPRIFETARRTGAHPLLIHAEAAGVLLAEALKAAGRDLTRAGLLRALGAAALDDIGLDYARFPLSGTDAVAFLPLR